MISVNISCDLASNAVSLSEAPVVIATVLASGMKNFSSKFVAAMEMDEMDETSVELMAAVSLFVDATIAANVNRIATEFILSFEENTLKLNWKDLSKPISQRNPDKFPRITE